KRQEAIEKAALKQLAGTRPRTEARQANPAGHGIAARLARLEAIVAEGRSGNDHLYHKDIPHFLGLAWAHLFQKHGVGKTNIEYIAESKAFYWLRTIALVFCCIATVSLYCYFAPALVARIPPAGRSRFGMLDLPPLIVERTATPATICL